MTILPDQGLATALANQAAHKQYLEDLRDVIAETPGGSAETELTIAGGTITPTGPAHTVDTENNSPTDDLANMALTNQPDGREVKLRAANAGRTVALKNMASGDGQLLLIGGTDKDMTTSPYVWFMRVGLVWVEILEQTSGSSIPLSLTRLENNVALNTFRIFTGTSLSSGELADGYEWVFDTDELTTKTGATYDATGNFYTNAATEGADITTQGNAISLTNTGTANNAFDNVRSHTDSSAYWDGSVDPNEFIGQNFGPGGAVVIGRMTLQNGNSGATRFPAKVTIEYSDDGGVWSSAGITTPEVTVTSFPTEQLGPIQSIPVEGSPGAHQYWRLRSSDNTGQASSWRCVEVEMFEKPAATDMTLGDDAKTAEQQPTLATFFVLHKAVDSVTLGTDFQIRASRDNGVTFSLPAQPPAVVARFDPQFVMLRADVSIVGQPAGTDMKWEIKTFNGKTQEVRAVSMLWE